MRIKNILVNTRHTPVNTQRLVPHAGAVAGYSGNGESVEPEAWIEAEGVGKLDERMFVARAVGRSMEPTIRDGDFLVFRANPIGTRQGNIVLAQYRGLADPETGGVFTVKRYASEKARAAWA